MGKLIKRLVFLVGSLVVVLVVFGVYVAVVAGVDVPGLSTAFRADPKPPSPETLAHAEDVENRIDEEVTGNAAFFLEFTDEDLTALIQTRAGDAAPTVRDLTADINPDEINVSGSLNGRIGVPFSAKVAIVRERGVVQIEVRKVSFAFAGLPDAVKDELQPLIDEALDINKLLGSSDIQIQQVTQTDGKLTLAGIQTGGDLVSDLTVESLIGSYSGGSEVPVPPGASEVPPGRTGGAAGDALYLALGDSLAANVGASSPVTGYVSRFHAFLERRDGTELGLTNLGVSGESSISIFQSQLPAALAAINQRNNDGDPSTRVAVLTLDLGPNDIIGHLGSADCQEDMRGEECTARIDAGIETFEENFAEIVSSLAAALDEDAEFYVIKAYNPFDFGIGIPFEADSNEVIERLNTIIEDVGEAEGATVADPFTIMAGKAGAWTHMLDGDIHPTDDGYQAMAYSLAVVAQP